METVYSPTSKRYAINTLNKAQLLKHNITKSATVEKNALATVNLGIILGLCVCTLPFMMRRHYVRCLLYPCLDRWRKLTDPDSADLVLSLAPNGDLRELVKKYGPLSLSCARYYVAQVVDTVRWIHSKGILHRDLKPENILLDSDMPIELMNLAVRMSRIPLISVSGK